MMKYILLLACCLLASSLAMAQAATFMRSGGTNSITTTPRGGVCLMGGATENIEAMRWFVRRANGGDVLVLRTSGTFAYNDYIYYLLGVPVNSVETIIMQQAGAVNLPYIQQRINEAEAIWFAGGDQAQYVNFWRNTAVDSLINHAIQTRNIVVGGTSAGMAILGQYYFSAQAGTITSAAATTNPFAPAMAGLDTTPFLKVPYLENTITDSHFNNPDRRGRLSTFVARLRNMTGKPVRGIAANDYTAVCIDSVGQASIYGLWPTEPDQAYFVSANCAVTNNVPETMQAGSPLTWDQGGQAISVFRANGVQNNSSTASRFNVAAWQEDGSNSNGQWERWWIIQGGFQTATTVAPACSPLTSSASQMLPQLRRVYPVPATDRLFIDGPVTQAVHLVNTLGQVWPLNLHGGSASLQGIPAGAYVLQVDGVAHRVVVR